MARDDLTAMARAEVVARASYGRLLALLAARTGDIPGAEDALGDAFVQALSTWPVSGAPANPEGWLMTVARNRQRDRAKSAAERSAAPLAEEPRVFDELNPDAIPDKRLELMFVCAHPAIDPGIRTPLMLQTVLGFEAEQIARAFAVPTATMAQRLVRAKRRIREARIPFVVPTRADMPARLPGVLEAIYGAYAIDWLLVSGERESLAAESLYLASTLATLLRNEPETYGLAALIAFSFSRAKARTDADGRFVPLEEQDTTRWDATLIARGDDWLRRAARAQRLGRFQLEAAIQAVHAARARTGLTDWWALRTLNTALVELTPTLGARVSLAATIGTLDGPDAGLAALDAIEDADRFQPAWATRAHLLAERGATREASAAYEKAISLTTEPALRAYLTEKATRLSTDGETRV